MSEHSNDFTHLDKDHNPHMVDVGEKNITKRVAIAESRLYLPDVVMQHFSNNEITTKKGAVFQIAIIAGIMGAKKTSELIPLCHPIGMDNCNVSIGVEDSNEVVIRCEAKVTSKTGVEMEALTGASVAALTIYDMCKAFSHDIVIKETRLISKTGGKSDYKKA